MFRVKGLERDEFTGEYFGYVVGTYETREQAEEVATENEMLTGDNTYVEEC